MAKIQLYQAGQLPPKRIGAVKPPLFLANQSGEKQLGQTIANIGRNVWGDIIQAREANEKAIFLGAEKLARENLRKKMIAEPFASPEDMTKWQQDTISEIEKAGQVSKMPEVNKFAKNWLAENKPALEQNISNDMAEITKQHQQRMFNVVMDGFEKDLSGDSLDNGLAYLKSQKGILLNDTPMKLPDGTTTSQYDEAVKAFTLNKNAQFSKIAIEANKQAAIGEAFNVWQGTITEENPDGDLNTAFDAIQADPRISSDDKQDVESELKTRVSSRRAEEQLQLDAQKSADTEKINQLVFFDKNYDAAMNSVKTSNSLTEKEKKTWYSDIDRRATAAAKGIPLSNDRVEEARLYEKSLDIWRGNISKKEFDKDLLKNSKKLDDSAYQRVSTSAANVLKSSQAEALSRANAEASKLIVDFKEDDAFENFLRDIDTEDKNKIIDKRQLQFWYLSQYNTELRQWIEDNPDKLGKEFYQFSEQLKHQYWNTSIEEIKALKLEREAELAKGVNKTTAEPAIINTQTEYDALPSGTRYKDANGNIGTKQ